MHYVSVSRAFLTRERICEDGPIEPLVVGQVGEGAVLSFGLHHGGRFASGILVLGVDAALDTVKVGGPGR